MTDFHYHAPLDALKYDFPETAKKLVSGSEGVISNHFSYLVSDDVRDLKEASEFITTSIALCDRLLEMMHAKYADDKDALGAVLEAEKKVAVLQVESTHLRNEVSRFLGIHAMLLDAARPPMPLDDLPSRIQRESTAIDIERTAQTLAKLEPLKELIRAIPSDDGEVEQYREACLRTLVPIAKDNAHRVHRLIENVHNEVKDAVHEREVNESPSRELMRYVDPKIHDEYFQRPDPDVGTSGMSFSPSDSTDGTDLVQYFQQQVDSGRKLPEFWEKPDSRIKAPRLKGREKENVIDFAAARDNQDWRSK